MIKATAPRVWAWTALRWKLHSTRSARMTTDGGDTNACISVVGGDLVAWQRMAVRRKGNTSSTNVRRRGQNTAERGLRGEQSNAVMAVGRMAYVGVIVERDDVSNGRRLAWCFMVVIMLRSTIIGTVVLVCEKMDKAVR